MGSTATHRNAVRLAGEVPVGDVFTTLGLWFGPSGLATDTQLGMPLDTDVAITAPASTVPEPATWALLGGGRAATGAAARRRAGYRPRAVGVGQPGGRR